MSDEQAATLHLVNKQGLLSTFARTPAEVAAISGYGLSIASPQVVPLDAEHQSELQSALDVHYELVREVPSFGQAATTLKIYRARTNEQEAP